MFPALGMAQDGGPFQYDESGKNTSSVNLDFRGHDFSGICVLRQEGNQVLGSIVNQFGIKAFDFIYDAQRGKVKLQSVMKMMNRWYIRKVMRSDLQYLFSHNTSCSDKRHLLQVEEGSAVTLQNTKYHIVYQFTPITDEVAR